MKIEFSSEKADMVKKSLAVKEEYDEEIRHPWLVWVPVIFMILMMGEYFTYPLREDISKFFNDDATIPFIFGTIFGVGFLAAAIFIYFMRRTGLYIMLLVMIGEWIYYGAFGLLKVVIIDGKPEVYPMFGAGMLPGIENLMPLHTLIIRQAIIFVSALLLWRRYF